MRKYSMPLHAPIYYYVKRKGSLASQGINISKTVKMKLNVFEYYNNFYKHVLEEEDYGKNRLQVYRFFIDAAGDGTVPPSILPSSKKLGRQRESLSIQRSCWRKDLQGEDYRIRKLLEHYLEPVALKGDLKVMDVRLLCVCVKARMGQQTELADFAGITGRI